MQDMKFPFSFPLLKLQKKNFFIHQHERIFRKAVLETISILIKLLQTRFRYVLSEDSQLSLSLSV
jgi:hypothetical protein